jgi:hypothetical protein
MGDGYKFYTQSMQHLFELMLNLFVVSANCHYVEYVYYEFVNSIKYSDCSSRKLFYYSLLSFAL